MNSSCGQAPQLSSPPTPCCRRSRFSTVMSRLRQLERMLRALQIVGRVMEGVDAEQRQADGEQPRSLFVRQRHPTDIDLVAALARFAVITEELLAHRSAIESHARVPAIAVGLLGPWSQPRDAVEPGRAASSACPIAGSWAAACPGAEIARPRRWHRRRAPCRSSPRSALHFRQFHRSSVIATHPDSSSATIRFMRRVRVGRAPDAL